MSTIITQAEQEFLVQKQQHNQKKLKEVYISKLNDNIDFIKYLNEQLPQENKIICFKFLCSLWQQMVDNSSIEEEKDILYRWLKDFASVHCYQPLQQQQQVQNIKEVGSFVLEQLQKNQSYINALSLSGFECFHYFFVSLNLIEDRISSLQEFRGYGSFYSAINTSLNEELQFEYQVRVAPDQLLGF